MSIFRPWILPIVLLGLVVCGCSHELEVTNEEDFPSVSPFESTKRGLRVALAVSGDNEMKDAIGQAIAGSLVALGGYQLVDSMANADVVARVTVGACDKSGRLSNVVIAFPGIAVFAHAWLGYGYEVDFPIECTVTAAKSGRELYKKRQPIELNLRHADFGRTWMNFLAPTVMLTIANGLYCISYDEDIDAELPQKAAPWVGVYVASEMIRALNDAPVAPVKH